MLIFDENSEAIILDNIHAPTPTDNFWILDLEMMDFTLVPLLYLEEITCSSIQVRVGGFDFMLPTGWNMLVYDEETHQVDVAEIKKLPGKEFTAMVYGPEYSNVVPGKVIATDYSPSFTNIAPHLQKNQMLCHPIGPNEWINIAPTDIYNKYLKDCNVGDIII